MLHRRSSPPAQAPPLKGPYATEHTVLSMLDPHPRPVDVYYSTNAAAPPRFLSFAHGTEGGWVILPAVYHTLLHGLASWGYVVAATRACIMGSNVPWCGATPTRPPLPAVPLQPPCSHAAPTARCARCLP